MQWFERRPLRDFSECVVRDVAAYNIKAQRVVVYRQCLDMCALTFSMQSDIKHVCSYALHHQYHNRLIYKSLYSQVFQQRLIDVYTIYECGPLNTVTVSKASWQGMLPWDCSLLATVQVW